MMIAAVVLVVTFISGVNCQTCDLAGSLQCLRNVSVPDIMYNLNETTVNASQIVNSLCSSLEQVYFCIGNKMSTCSAQERLLYDTMLAGGRFLCNEGKEDFIANLRCITSPMFLNRAVTCFSSVLTLIGNMSTDSSPSDVISKLSTMLCSSEDRIVSCITTATAKECGKDAETFMQRYLNVTLQPLTRYLCFAKTTTTPSSTTTATSTTRSTTEKNCVKTCFYSAQFRFNVGWRTILKYYNTWCTNNCSRGFCPASFCTCGCGTPGAITCHTVKGSRWCQQTLS